MAKLAVMIEGQEGLTWERWFRLIEATESLGFDSLWRSDHLFSVMGQYQRDSLALWPSLTVVATQSQRIEFGPLVCPVTFRDPVELAREATALDLLSGGRFVLGVGAGWNEAEHAAFGYPLPPVRERMDRLEEAIKVIKLLWTGEPVDFDGTYYHLRGAQAHPTPTRPGGVPLLIGGSGARRLLRLVALYADEWNVTSMRLEQYGDRVRALEEHCAAVGRDPKEIRRSWMLGHLIGRDRDDLLERAARLQRILPSLQGIPVEAVPDRARERGWLVGTPQEIVEQLRARIAYGVDRFMLQTHDQEDIGALELFAREVMPAIAEA